MGDREDKVIFGSISTSSIVIYIVLQFSKFAVVIIIKMVSEIITLFKRVLIKNGYLHWLYTVKGA
jgi:hypothetical protein